MSPSDVLDRYEATRQHVMTEAKQVLDEDRLSTRDAVMAPLDLPHLLPTIRTGRSAEDRRRLWGGRLPEDGPPLTLAQSINATLTDLMDAQPASLLFGQDVAIKGGVYGVTRGLRKRFGGLRVFDTLLDEQTVLGTALGTALAGFVPIPEIQYLAYIHNAEDQLRGEAATLRFFSNEQYQNGMVVRIAGLGYQSGFGGHFHNDNSVAVLRDIPGLVIATPSHPADAPGMLRTCFSLAQQDGRVCVFLEPIAKYHTRDHLEEGDGGWTAGYVAPDDVEPFIGLDEVGLHGDGRDVLLVTFGNGVHLSRPRRPCSPNAAWGPRCSTCAGWHPSPRKPSTKQPDTSTPSWSSTRPGAAAVSPKRSSRRWSTVDIVAASHGSRAPTRSSRSGPAAGTVLLSVDDIVAATEV